MLVLLVRFFAYWARSDTGVEMSFKNQSSAHRTRHSGAGLIHFPVDGWAAKTMRFFLFKKRVA